ncbi:MAG: hypothetical protein H7124_08800 [Phycisphaerales bacterium]|nr:hypothetical protein [Hyphomonadaceae bacterium]
MNQPLDPFAQSFDSIEIGARPSAAFDHALALAAVSAAAPDFASSGFHLLDDAGGRFIVDREFGVVSLKDDALLGRERGAVHSVRLKVVEASGASYELDMQLRITGHVPQMVGAEDFGFLPGEPTTAPAIVAPPRAQIAWSTFTALQDAGAPSSLRSCGAAPYGALLCVSLPVEHAQSASLLLGEQIPAPSGRSAAWSI